MADRNMASLRAGGVTLVAVLCLALAACGEREGSERPPQPGDAAVARVDGKVVWASDVKREAVAQGLVGRGELLNPSSDVFQRVLDQLVDQRLLANEAVARKLDRGPDAERRLAAARERVLSDLLVESVVDEAVTEQAVRELYQEQAKLSALPGEEQAPPITLEQARPQIVRFLTYDQVRDLLEKLRAKARVETLLKPAPVQPAAKP